MLSRLISHLKSLAAYALFVSRRIVEDRCLTVAGSLTFTTLLALVPLFTVTVTLTSRLPFTRDLIQQLKAFVISNFVPTVSGKMIGTYVDQFANNAARLTWIGLAIVLVTAVALLFTIENTFNAIWRSRRSRKWWHRLRWAFALLVLGPFLVAASLSVTFSLVKLAHVFESAIPALDDAMLRTIPWLTTGVLLYTAERWIPNRFVPARHAMAGALVAAVLFEVMKSVFVLYVTKVPTYSVVYGAFASVPIVLLWLFFCWLVVLLGAEIAATLSYVRHTDAQRMPPSTEEAAIRLLAAMDAADQPRTFEQLRAAAPMPIDVAEDALYNLIDGAQVVITPGRFTTYRKRAPEE